MNQSLGNYLPVVVNAHTTALIAINARKDVFETFEAEKNLSKSWCKSKGSKIKIAAECDDSKGKA
eukprot:scaffold26581_cov26-Cyclotella_meneghiniana.AAC.3